MCINAFQKHRLNTFKYIPKAGSIVIALLFAIGSVHIWAEEIVSVNSAPTVVTENTESSLPPQSQPVKNSMAVVAERVPHNGGLSPASVLGQVAMGLGAVTLLIFGLAWLAKRLGYAQSQGTAQMKVLANLPLGHREKAVLIEVEGVRMLLGVAPGRVNYLQQLDAKLTESETTQHQEPLNEKTGFKYSKGQEFARYLKSVMDHGGKA